MDKVAKLTTAKQISVCVFNLENFYLDQEDFITELQTPMKALDKIKNIQTIFREIDADIFSLCEIGGLKSLELFNKEYLDDEYQVLIEKGNSDRGIEVGFLVKKSLGLKLKFVSNKDAYFQIQMNERKTISSKHSRDLIELHLSNEANETKCIIFNTHLKSQRDSYNEDFRGQKRRGAEFNFMVEKLLSYESKKISCPIFLTGDLNGNASRFQTDPEFIKGLIKADLIDVLDCQDLPREARATYYIFAGTKKLPIQLDYALFNKTHKECILDAVVYRYKNQHQSVKFSPRSKLDVLDNPSDHYPLVFCLSLDHK